MTITDRQTYISGPWSGHFVAAKNLCVMKWKCSLYKLSSAKDWLKVSFYYRGLGLCLWFLTGDLQVGVIFDIIDHVGRWSGRYHKSLMKMGHVLADWFHLGLGGQWGFLIGEIGDDYNTTSLIIQVESPRSSKVFKVFKGLQRSSKVIKVFKGLLRLVPITF